MLAMKAKSAGMSTIFKVMDDVFPMVQTSLTKNEILSLIPSVIGYSIGNTTGFPMEYKFANVKGSVIVPTSLESNVIELHKYLYGEDVAYTPSTTVKERSAKILEIVGGEQNIVDTAPVVEDDTVQDDFVWQSPSTDDGSGEGDYDPNYDPNYDPDYDPNYDPNYDPDYDPNQGGGDDGSGGGDYDPNYDPDYNPDQGGGDDGSGDDGSGGGDVGGGDTGGGDVGGGDMSGGDVGGGDTGGGDMGGGETGEVYQ